MVNLETDLSRTRPSLSVTGISRGDEFYIGSDLYRVVSVSGDRITLELMRKGSTSIDKSTYTTDV